MGAVAYVQGLVGLVDDAKDKLHAHSEADVVPKIERLQQDVRAQQREIAKLQQQIATGGSGGGSDPIDVSGIKVLVRRVTVPDAKALRSAADALRDKLGSGIVVLGAEADGKAMLLVAVTKDLEARVPAGKLIAVLAPHVDGKGGGRPELAQAGGPKVEGLDAALDAATTAIAAQLGA
jgi:alanyl-tRNA synthetase